MESVALETTSTYRILPRFLEDSDPLLTNSVNGWNSHLESWLMDVQTDCHTQYLMLVETARFLVVVKWIMLVALIWVPSSAAVIVTIVAILVDPNQGNIWLPIFNACVAAVTATVLTIYEAMDMNTWIDKCRSTAGEFIVLGRGIETIKRVPRIERSQTGLEFTNEVSNRFEQLRAGSPAIVSHIQKRHAVPQQKTVQLLAAQTTVDNTDLTAALMSASGSSSIDDRRKTFSLQELFNVRRKQQEDTQRENDELVQYEEYVRNSYGGALANNAPPIFVE